jgi:hypothetical protein
MSDSSGPDDELLDDLRSVIGRVDPVPADVTDFAKAALGWRRLDTDLAELLTDSALETQATALTRSGSSGGRWLSFRAGELTIDVEVRSDGAARVMLGQLAPAPAAVTVELQAAGGEVAASARSDELGRFRLGLEVGGRVRLLVLRRDPPAATVETSWFSI